MARGEIPTLTVHSNEAINTLDYRVSLTSGKDVAASCIKPNTGVLSLFFGADCLTPSEKKSETVSIDTCDENSSIHSIVRTRSQDRLWNEAKRFYEVVCEDESFLPEGTQEIIDEDSSEDEAEESLCRTQCHDQDILELSHRTNVSCHASISFVELNQVPRVQPMSPSTRISFSHLLPGQTSCLEDNSGYKGVPNPPEIIKRGTARGNAAQIHRKAWLEVSDKYHRYGKNLRIYYKYWESIGYPTNDFFDWLDSKGAAQDQPLPSVDECPRCQLESDTVLYITDPEITKQYALEVITNSSGKCCILDKHKNPVRTGPDGWIFVLRDDVLYGSAKIASSNKTSKQRFHHSSFFAGKAVSAAGIFITNDAGFLDFLYPHSGHYRPGEAALQRALLFFFTKGVDLRTFQVDVQQLVRVNRQDRKRKTDSLQLKLAADVAHLLSHKARFVTLGILSQIQLACVKEKQIMLASQMIVDCLQ